MGQQRPWGLDTPEASSTKAPISSAWRFMCSGCALQAVICKGVPSCSACQHNDVWEVGWVSLCMLHSSRPGTADDVGSPGGITSASWLGWVESLVRALI